MLGNERSKNKQASNAEILSLPWMGLYVSSFVCEITELHRNPIWHGLEAILLIERSVFALLRHDLDIEIVPVLLFHHLDHVASDPAAVIGRVHQNIVHIGHQLTVSISRTRPTRRSPSQAVMTVEECISAL